MDKKAVTITITDLNDEEKVLEALSKLFTTIFSYYLQNDKSEQFYRLVMSCGVYFGSLIQKAGLNPEEFGENKDNE